MLCITGWWDRVHIPGYNWLLTVWEGHYINYDFEIVEVFLSRLIFPDVPEMHALIYWQTWFWDFKASDW